MIPTNSPRAFYDALCSGCGEKMRPVIQKQNNGVVLDVQYACDNCKYQVSASLPYINTTPAKYVEPPKEVRPAVLEPSEQQKAAMRASLVPNPKPPELPSQPIQIPSAPVMTVSAENLTISTTTPVPVTDADIDHGA